jgi:anaerobic selenocysteine-containing dehydrogenase
MREPAVNLSSPVADEVKTTTCYMCACRCGIQVHLKDGQIRYIDGNRAHPVNKGVICGKGAAGIMQHLAPSRLTSPMLRVGERGKGEFRAISWDEALALATEWLGSVRRSDPRKLAFFTGRDQSQALTGWFAKQFGTPNYAAHGGFCSVNMAAAGLYTIGGSFWEFGEPDWDHTRYFMLFGVAEDHASNPLKIGLGRLKARGAKVVGVNPVRTGYNAIADEWIGITPGTDGLFVSALIHELMRLQAIDLEYLVRYTNAPWLVIEAPGSAEHGLFARDGRGRVLARDKASGEPVPAEDAAVSPALTGSARLPDGRMAVPVFELLAKRFCASEYAPEAVAPRIGVAAEAIRRIAAEIAHVAFKETVTLDVAWTDWAGRRHDKMVGRPVSMHAMRGISAHTNGFQTCRLLHVLQMLIGSIDVPGGFRFKPPYPRGTPPALRPSGHPRDIVPDTPLPGPNLGFPMGPEDLLLDADGKAQRIDKAYSWDAPLAAHGLMHTVIANAANHDPYPIEVLFLYMANMGWNSSMNVGGTLEALTRKTADGSYAIPRIIYSDAYLSETVAYADLVLPDTTYLERWDCISLLDRPISDADHAADAIRHPVVSPDRDVRPFQDVVLDLGARLRLPGFVDAVAKAAYPGGYSDYIVNHQRVPGIGSLAAWRGEDGAQYGQGVPHERQLTRYIQNGSFFARELAPAQRYFKHANRDYLEFAKSAGFIERAQAITFQIYVEPLQKFRLAAEGHGSRQPPETHRARIARAFDPLPLWYAADDGTDASFPLHAITQRPMAMYHAWGSQNAWLRQIHGENRLYMHRERARVTGVADDDWVWITSAIGRVKAQVRLMDGVNPETVWTWNAIGKRAGAWALSHDAPEATRGFLLNHLIADLLPERDGGYRFSNSDPVTGQAAWYDLRVRIERAEPEPAGTAPRFEPLFGDARARVDVLDFGRAFNMERTP